MLSVCMSFYVNILFVDFSTLITFSHRSSSLANQSFHPLGIFSDPSATHHQFRPPELGARGEIALYCTPAYILCAIAAMQ